MSELEVKFLNSDRIVGVNQNNKAYLILGDIIMYASSGSIPSISWCNKLDDEFLKLNNNPVFNPDDAKVAVLKTGCKTRILTVSSQSDNWLVHKPGDTQNISLTQRLPLCGKLVKLKDCDCYVHLFSICNARNDAEVVEKKLGSQAGALKALEGHYAVITTFYPVTPSVGDKSQDHNVPLKPGFQQQRLEYVYCSEHRDTPLEVISNSSLEIRTRKLGSRDVKYIKLNTERPLYSHGINLTSYFKAVYHKDQPKAQGFRQMPGIDPFSDNGTYHSGYCFGGNMGNSGGGSYFRN